MCSKLFALIATSNVNFRKWNELREEAIKGEEGKKSWGKQTLGKECRKKHSHLKSSLGQVSVLIRWQSWKSFALPRGYGQVGANKELDQSYINLSYELNWAQSRKQLLIYYLQMTNGPLWKVLNLKLQNIFRFFDSSQVTDRSLSRCLDVCAPWRL